VNPILARLPPGRHGLPREFVKENQLARITVATIATVAEVGYQQSTISQLVKAAGLSRRTFYVYFQSKEACFLGALEAIADHLRASAQEAAEGAGGVKRLEAEIRSVVEVFEANPKLGICCLVEAPIAEEEIKARYRGAVRGLTSRLAAAVPEGGQSETELLAAVSGALAILRRGLETDSRHLTDETIEFLRASVL
jgi:AcrR family transcriptional regulator